MMNIDRVVGGKGNLSHLESNSNPPIAEETSTVSQTSNKSRSPVALPPSPQRDQVAPYNHKEGRERSTQT